MLILRQILQALIRHIPNAITSLNLFCGCLSIQASLNGELKNASLFIGIAAVLDFFDGMVARGLKVHSEIGKQLDSLADVVSFGVAPSFILFILSMRELSFPLNYIVFLIAIFSAIRLAKFNLDTRQSDSFIGLPTPANATFIASLPFILSDSASVFFDNPYFYILFPFLSAYMLVAELPLLALKFKSFGWEGNEYRFILIIGCALCIAFFQYFGVALSIVLYILISIIYNFQSKKKHEVHSRN